MLAGWPAGRLAGRVLALTGCERRGSEPTGLLRADDPQMLALGKTIYEARCAACHGATGGATELAGARYCRSIAGASP